MTTVGSSPWCGRLRGHHAGVGLGHEWAGDGIGFGWLGACLWVLASWARSRSTRVSYPAAMCSDWVADPSRAGTVQCCVHRVVLVTEWRSRRARASGGGGRGRRAVSDGLPALPDGLLREHHPTRRWRRRAAVELGAGPAVPTGLCRPLLVVGPRVSGLAAGILPLALSCPASRRFTAGAFLAAGCPCGVHGRRRRRLRARAAVSPRLLCPVRTGGGDSRHPPAPAAGSRAWAIAAILAFRPCNTSAADQRVRTTEVGGPRNGG